MVSAELEAGVQIGLCSLYELKHVLQSLLVIFQGLGGEATQSAIVCASGCRQVPWGTALEVYQGVKMMSHTKNKGP